MGASFLVGQIPTIVNDAYTDVMGASASIKTLDANALVTMGKALSDFDLLDKWYGALTNRIIKTVVFARRYSADTRQILKDENNWGAFIQKIYVKAPDAVDNPAFKGEPVSGQITPYSPYDVTQALEAEVMLYGTEGTWAYEFVMPSIQIQKAFTSPAEMNAFVDGQFVAVLNKIEVAKEALINLACNVGIADSIKNSKYLNLVEAYAKATGLGAGETLKADDMLMDKDFLKFASKTINRYVKFIQKPTTRFNIKGYETFTPKDKLIVECLTDFAQSSAYYLESDTFHKELVELPNYSEVPFWQHNSDDFDGCSEISIKHKDINGTNVYTKGGIVAVLRDEEFVGAHFGDEYQWSMPNPRQRLSIYGYEYKKGYAVDEHANAFVFTMVDYTAPTSA